MRGGKGRLSDEGEKIKDERGLIVWRLMTMLMTYFHSYVLFFSANRVETVRFLLQKGASVNPTYPGGNT